MIDTEGEHEVSTTTGDTLVEPGDADATPAGPRRRSRTTTVLALLAVLAVLLAVAAGVYWYLGTRGPAASASLQRDLAVDAAEQIVVNINTVRPETLDADLAAAQNSLTDPMLTEYGKVRQRFADSLRQTRASVVATSIGASLTTIDTERGTASALVAIDVRASSATTPPTQKQQLFQVEMQRTPDGWKAAKAAPSTGQN